MSTILNVRRIVFVDETKAQAFRLVAVTVWERDVVVVRRSMNALRRNNQRRIHFKNESDDVRKKVLAAIVKMPIDVTYKVVS